MIKTTLTAAMLAVLGGTFASGIALAGPSPTPPTPPSPGCHASMPPQLCDIIWKRDKKGPKASVQRLPSRFAVRPR